MIRYQASYVKQEYRRTVDTVFNQATKKDAYKVTAGKYTMSTTKKGKLIHQIKPYDVQLKKLWRIGRECGKLTVQYRMGHTLEDMGIQLRPTDWTKIVSRKDNGSRASSTSSVELQGSSPNDSPVASTIQTPSETTDSSTTTSTEPPVLNISPSVVSLSPVDVLRSPTLFLAQGSGGVQCFPGLILPVKTEPEDIKPDITMLQKCVSTHN